MYLNAFSHMLQEWKIPSIWLASMWVFMFADVPSFPHTWHIAALFKLLGPFEIIFSPSLIMELICSSKLPKSTSTLESNKTIFVSGLIWEVVIGSASVMILFFWCCFDLVFSFLTSTLFCCWSIGVSLVSLSSAPPLSPFSFSSSAMTRNLFRFSW